MERKPVTTDTEKNYIQRMLLAGCSERDISVAINKSIRTVQRWKARFLKDGNMQNKKRPGPSRITTPEEDAAIIDLVSKKGFTTAREIIQELGLNCDRRTVKNRLHENNFRSRSLREKKCIGRHDQFQERTDLESSKVITEIKVKSEEDEEGINSFDKDNDQSKSVLERSEIKIEVVEHDIKQEVLQDDSINIEPKLNSNDSMNNMALKLEDNRLSNTSRPETLLLDSEENGTRIKSEFVKCESAYDADMCDESEINCNIAAFQLHTEQNFFK